MSATPRLGRTKKTVITYSWTCLGRAFTSCDEHGEGPKSDLAARKHGEATTHGTKVVGRPA